MSIRFHGRRIRRNNEFRLNGANKMICKTNRKICMKNPTIYRTILKSRPNVNDCSNDASCDESFRLRRLYP